MQNTSTLATLSLQNVALGRKSHSKRIFHGLKEDKHSLSGWIEVHLIQFSIWKLSLTFIYGL